MTSEQKDTQHLEDEQQGGRKRILSRKALQNAVEVKRRDVNSSQKLLLQVMKSAERLEDGCETENILRDLTTASEDFKVVLEQLYALYEQDNYNDYEEEALLTSESLILKHAYLTIERIKNSQTNKSLETKSRLSRHSRYSRASSGSRSSRMLAQAEAAEAHKSAEFDKLIAEKEHERTKLEAEILKDLAVLAANKKVAVADAKLKAIDQAIDEEEIAEEFRDLPDIPNAQNRERVLSWVHTPEHSGTETRQILQAITRDIAEEIPKTPMNMANSTIEDQITHVQKDKPSAHHATSQPLAMSTPIGNVSGNQFIESLTSVNQQIVAGLAKQNLPKCHPDIFEGDATLFHPWKTAFKAMIEDANVTPAQEINYLRSFTSGEVQTVVDNFRKRHQRNPVALLESLWRELERRFGSAAVITNALLQRMQQAATFNENDNSKLQQFADLCADVESQVTLLPGLACLNYPMAIQPIVVKLPLSLRRKWEKTVANHADRYGGAYPGFETFAKIVHEQSKLKNNPNILAGNAFTSNVPNAVATQSKTTRRVLRTNTDFNSESEQSSNAKASQKGHCPFHERNGHTLEDCKAFGAKSVEEKTEWILKAGLCFRCLAEGHTSRTCKLDTECSICKDKRHITLLHKERPNNQDKKADPPTANPKCTAICGVNRGGTSCSKILLLDVYHKDRPESCHRVYAIVDEQSNTSLISSELADELGANSLPEKYFLSTCGRERELKYGRRVPNITAKPLNGTLHDLPTLVECDGIPQDKHEIPTPETARRFPHLSSIATEIPPIDNDVDIHLLIGRDAPELLKVREFRNGPKEAPWAQKLDLGWTITGQMCLDLVDGPAHVAARRTSVHAENDTAKPDDYELARCPNTFKVKETMSDTNLSNDIFYTTKDDNDPSLSVDDRKFLEIMETGIHKNKAGNWEMPLPFRRPDAQMPNNRIQAVRRLNSLLRTLRRKPQMEKDYLEFMGKVLEKGHASAIPSNELQAKQARVWYLPHFGVYHPKKPTQIRVVFDSSAEHEGVSLNKELLAGPDMMNSLIGVLMRFRREIVGAMCDIEQMFHSFSVNSEHRDFLRFLWFTDNDPSKPITEYRMAVHLFGNGPSPAVATYGLRRTVKDGEELPTDVKEFVNRNFYVDDGLVSTPTAEETVELIRDTQAALATANLRLHKVVSNSVTVMQAFPTDDLAKDIKSLDLHHDELPAQRSLGVSWDLEKDAFTYKVTLPDKPFTRRGVLSLVNSIYDPLGIAAPVLLEGRLLLQELVALGKKTKGENPLGWDDPLPDRLANRWQSWRKTLPDLQNAFVSRCYHPAEFGRPTRAEIHTFSDASQNAIGIAVYLRLFNERNEVAVSLVFGQAKVAPLKSTSIPRLELCGAVLAVQATDKVMKEIDLEISDVTFYTDSKVVLGYIRNESRRFYVYVANRVQIIHNLSTPDQWMYIETSKNPADLATRGLKAKDLTESSWLNGPEFLRTGSDLPLTNVDQPALNEGDPEVRKESNVKSTNVQKRRGLGSERFTRFSSLISVQRAIATLIAKAKEFKRRRNEPNLGGAKKKPKSSSGKNALRKPTVRELQQAMTIIIRTVQEDAFGQELRIERTTVAKREEHQRIRDSNKKRAQKKSKLFRLDPFLDEDGLLRVGGRLRRADLEYGEKHPAILPKSHHVSRLVARHYHNKVHHQGRQITNGAIRQAGYWLIGSHGIVTSELNQCVICKKLRGPPMVQRMADLPIDRTQVAPPFTSVGFDVFGPWTIHTRRTRGGAVNSKRWGLVFTCLNSRAIHIEVLESMDASSFICALRRFLALRGPAVLYRCDRGTNFVGGKSELDAALREMDKEKIEKYLTEQGCEWLFNPPHASNFGGTWERQIGTIRRVLNGMFAELGSTQLTHELLVTLMAEVTAIVNARPIAALPTDVDNPQPLSPAMLLTMKTRPLGPPPGSFLPTDLYARRRWRRIQYLADQFWLRWRREYLQTLQTRPKWTQPKRNLVNGDIVLMKEEDANRNDWPMGRISEVIKSEDGKVRKAHVEIIRGGEKKKFLRPIKEFVLLIPTTHPDDTSDGKGTDSKKD